MKNIFLWRNRSLIKNHSLLDNPLILPQIQILISFWSQITEKQKFDIEENVMSEPVKMPVRHFLRRDYLHIFFYIKFLLFVSLVQQISIYNDSCNVVSISFNSPAPIWPGAEAFPTAPNVSADPNTSPHTRLITPVAAMDIVMIGRSA